MNIGKEKCCSENEDKTLKSKQPNMTNTGRVKENQGLINVIKVLVIIEKYLLLWAHVVEHNSVCFIIRYSILRLSSTTTF